MKKKSRLLKKLESCKVKRKSCKGEASIAKDSQLIESCPACERLNYGGYTDYKRWIGR
jgi:hypothetical protein